MLRSTSFVFCVDVSMARGRSRERRRVGFLPKSDHDVPRAAKSPSLTYGSSPPSMSRQLAAWRYEAGVSTLPEVYRTLRVPEVAGFFRKALAFAGPGFLVAVGYMDPGNWATDLAAGSAYGYTLLSVILLSNLMAILLQSLCIKLGVATGRDLGQACRDHFSRPVSFGLWVLCEVAIAACDLAEVIGSALALQLLFGIPLIWGVCLTALDVLLVLYLQNRGFRYLEALVIAMIAVIGLCFGLELLFCRPELTGITGGFLLPSATIVTDPRALYGHTPTHRCRTPDASGPPSSRRADWRS